MATYEVTGPDGNTYDVTAPDHASEKDVLAFAQSQWDSLKTQRRKDDANEYAGGFLGQRGDVKDMSAIERGLGGAKHAWDRAALGVKNLLPESVQRAGDWVDEKLGMTPLQAKQVQQGAAFVKEGGAAAHVGEFGGDVAMTAAPGMAGYRALNLGGKVLTKAAPAVVQAAVPWLAAGGSGAAVGAAVNPLDRKGGAISGGVGSVLGEGAGRVLGKVLGGIGSGGVSAEARALMDEGVNVPAWKAIEKGPIRDYGERVRGLPIVGPLMKAQEGAAIRDYNQTLIRKATPPQPVMDEAGSIIRWELPKAAPVKEVGQEGMNQLSDRFGKAYDAVYKNRTIPLDDQLAQALHGVGEAADAYTPGAAADINGLLRKVNDTLRKGTEETANVSKILDANGRPIVSATQGHAGVGNDQFKRALQDADEAVTSAWNSGDRVKAEAFSAIRDALQEARLRGLPPEVQSMLAPVNEAYRNFKLLQRASSAIGAVRNEGIVTPSQVVAATKALDKTPGKSATTRGMAFGQQEAQRAHNVLGSELPDVGPGTAEKMSVLAGLGGLGWLSPTAAASSLMLSRPGQRVMLGGYPWQASARAGTETMADLMRQAAQAKAVDRD